jgi:hypothetical protein
MEEHFGLYYGWVKPGNPASDQQNYIKRRELAVQFREDFYRKFQPLFLQALSLEEKALEFAYTFGRPKSIGPDKDTQFRELEQRDYIVQIASGSQLLLDLCFSLAENDQGEFPDIYWLCTERCEVFVWKGVSEPFLSDLYRELTAFMAEWGLADKTIAYGFVYLPLVQDLQAAGFEDTFLSLVKQRKDHETDRLRRWDRDPEHVDLDFQHNVFLEPQEVLGQLTHKSKYRYLNMMNNELTSLPEVLGSFPSLEKIYLSNNRITAETLDLEWFQQFSALDQLFISGNPVSADSSCMQELQRALPDCKVSW